MGWAMVSILGTHLKLVRGCGCDCPRWCRVLAPHVVVPVVVAIAVAAAAASGSSIGSCMCAAADVFAANVAGSRVAVFVPNGKYAHVGLCVRPPAYLCIFSIQ